MEGRFDTAITELQLSADEVIATINALDLYSRVWVGHVSHLDMELRMHRLTFEDPTRSKQTEDLLVAMRSIFLPECAGCGAAMNLGIWNERTCELAVCAYDMQQVIRHDWSWFCHPEGGLTRWFDVPFLRGSMPAPETACLYDDHGEPIMRIRLAREPLHLLLDALLAHQALLDVRLSDMMGLFTRDGHVLTIARILEGLYLEYPQHGHTGPSDADGTLADLCDRIALALGTPTDDSYRTLALECADRCDPLTFGERCPKECYR